jgi:hypothetical protein
MGGGCREVLEGNWDGMKPQQTTWLNIGHVDDDEEGEEYDSDILYPWNLWLSLLNH